jgi:hypothetical protein
MAVMIACGCDCHAPRVEGEVMLGSWCDDCFKLHAADPDVSPDILDTDPDPEEPMTTIPVPTMPEVGVDGVVAGTTEPETLTLIDRVIRPHSASDVDNLIRRANATANSKAFVQKAKGGEGTGTLGLYVEAVHFTGSGKPFTHMKYFVVGRHVYAYSRNNGDARANWRRRDTSSLHQSLHLVQVALDKPNVQLFGHPVLVELTAADLSQIEEGNIPEGRFRGQYRIEKDFGRYDFEMEIASQPLPAALVRTLRQGFVTETPA